MKKIWNTIIHPIKALEEKLVSDFKIAHKLASTWLAVLWGCIVTVFWNDPQLLSQILQAWPEQTRAWLSPVVMGFVTALPILVRLWKQQIKDNEDG